MRFMSFASVRSFCALCSGRYVVRPRAFCFRRTSKAQLRAGPSALVLFVEGDQALVRRYQEDGEA